MLPGNGTILLESIANINSALRSSKYHTKSSAVISATQQVQTVLGKLIKLCDDALLSEDEQNFIALNKDNIKELVEQLIDGVTVSAFKKISILQKKKNNLIFLEPCRCGE